MTIGAGQDIAAKKEALDAARPLPSEIVLALADWFELELVYSGLVLEGLAVSREQMSEALAGAGAAAPALLQAVRRLQGALQRVAALSYPGAPRVREQTVVELHRVLRRGVSPQAGQYRTSLVAPTGPGGGDDASRAAILPHFSRLPMLMKGLGDWLEITEPGVEMALEAHYRLVRVMPFADANHAVGRLLMNLLLGRAGYPPIIVYPEHVEGYLEALDTALIMGDKNRWRVFMTELLDQSLDACLVAAARGLVDEPAAGAESKARR